MTTLKIDNLVAGYGASTVLEGVSLEMGNEAVCIVGRNGMGKTTLCNTIMGFVKARSGSVTLDDRDITGATPEKVARAGVSYVPQGRRLFPSLSVDEHLRMLEGRVPGQWNAEAVYELFPRLAQRKDNGGAQLSGGEQQMLAVGRALMLNGPVLLMDEPSEGLAPTIVDHLVDAVHRLVADGTCVLIVEQNLRAASAFADRLLVMVSGRFEVEIQSAELLADHTLQRQYLGVDA